jgi:hypothetical protein
VPDRRPRPSTPRPSTPRPSTSRPSTPRPSTPRPSTRRLVAAVRALRPTREPHPPAGDHEARLDSLERDVAEVRTRVAALFFAVLGAGVLELVGRLVAR